MRDILLRRRKGAVKLGFSLRGGKEHGIGFFVSDVEIGSEAYLKGLRTGDEIIRVNGFSLRYAVHSDVIGLFRNAGNLQLTVQNAGILPVKEEKSDLHCFPAPVSPSLSHAEIFESNNKARDHHISRHKDDNITWKAISTPASPLIKKASINENVEMKLFLDMSNHQELGCTICKGPPEHPGIFIHSIKEKSLAYEVGLRAGDQIVQVNQQSFQDIDFQTAVKYLKSQKQLEIVITKGSGRDFIPAESSGYNSSTSSLNGENNCEEHLKHLIDESKKDNNLIEGQTGQLYRSINSDNQLTTKNNTCKTDEQDSQSDFIQSSEKFNSTSANTTNKQRICNEEIVSSLNNLEFTSLDDKDDEESVVEEIRKAAEEELEKHSWEKIDRDHQLNQKKTTVKDQEVQTYEYRSESIENFSNTTEEINNQKPGHIWQRTVIAEIHNNPLPAPPPLPKENGETVFKLQSGFKIKIDPNLKAADTSPPKMAEEMKKIAQHDQLIEEVKQAQKTMQQFQLENRGNKVQIGRNELKPEAFQNNNFSVPLNTSNNSSNPKETKSTRRGPLVTIGAYGDAGSRRTPNRFAFLSNVQQTDPPKKLVDNVPEKNNFTTYTTVIQNGPMKSTAVIDTSNNVTVIESKKISRFDENKVTIKVPAADYQNNQPKINGIISNKKGINQMQDNYAKHLSYDDIPIIIEELPTSRNENLNNPHKMFTAAEINGREILLYSISQNNLANLEIEGGLNTSLGGRIIISSVNKCENTYKPGLVKGDQLMWVNGYNLTKVTLSQAQNILQSFSNTKEPLNIIVAKAHPGLFDDVSFF